MQVPPTEPTGYQNNPMMMGPSPEEKQQSMLCWILSIFFGFLPGLIFFVMATDKPYLKRQAALALTLSIMGIIGFIASAILMLVLIGIVTYIATGIWVLVVCIQGAIATNKGEDFSPKFVDKFCMSMFKL